MLYIITILFTFEDNIQQNKYNGEAQEAGIVSKTSESAGAGR
jgi:hypothetical protein